MLIDWFTVIAQMVNFLVLVALLKRFLFTPITAVMRARREKIDADLDAAGKREEEAHKVEEAFQDKSRELDLRREGILREAREQAKKQGEEHLRQMRAEASAEQGRLREALELKIKEIGTRLRLMALHDAAGMARRTLEDLAGTPLEDGLVSAFIRQIENLDEESRARVASALREKDTTPEVRCTFFLKDDLRHRLEEAIQKGFAPGAAVRFEPAPGMPLGIEMDLEGYRLRWRIDQYLGDLEEEVAKAIFDAFGAPGEAKNA